MAPEAASIQLQPIDMNKVPAFDMMAGANQDLGYFDSDDYAIEPQHEDNGDQDQQVPISGVPASLEKHIFEDESEVRSLGVRCGMAFSCELEGIKIIENQRTKSPRFQSTEDLPRLAGGKVRKESGTTEDLERNNLCRSQRVQAYLVAEETVGDAKEPAEAKSKNRVAPITSLNGDSPVGPTSPTSPRRESLIDRMLHPLKMASPQKGTIGRGSLRHASKN
mmetsp:Transcript_21505/g.36994  ORF Transcript_21505/g.36994 Transcript_21505/m.36994 type:complete len:221 (-) Transcript_21505:1780-2442(-)